MSDNSEIMKKLSILATEREKLVEQLTKVDSMLESCRNEWYEKNPVPKTKYWFFNDGNIAKPPVLRNSPKECTYIYSDGSYCNSKAVIQNHEDAFCIHHKTSF